VGATDKRNDRNASMPHTQTENTLMEANMDFNTCSELLKNSDALHRGELVLSEEFISAEVEDELDTDLVREIDLTFARRHCMVDANVGKAGLLYHWVSSFALRSFDLNTDDRHVLFEQAGKGRVAPANFAAKAVGFASYLIPQAGPIVGSVIWVSLDQLAEALLNSKVRSSAEESGFEVDGSLWRYDLSSEKWKRHPAFTTVELPGLGEWTLLGDIIIVRRVDLQNGKISLKLDIHPSFKEAADYFGLDWHEVSVGGNSDSNEENPSDDEASLSAIAEGWSQAFSSSSKKISDLMEGHRSGSSGQLVDEEWRAEIEEAPALEPDNLDIEDAEELEALDSLDT